jgi:hypothetical protein
MSEELLKESASISSLKGRFLSRKETSAALSLKKGAGNTFA